MEFEDQFLPLMIFYWYVRRKCNYFPRVKEDTSTLSGARYTLELLYGSNRQCIELVRMSRDAFVLLCNHFRQRAWIN